MNVELETEHLKIEWKGRVVLIDLFEKGGFGKEMLMIRLLNTSPKEIETENGKESVSFIIGGKDGNKNAT